MRIALFATCLVDGLFPDVGMATATLLRRLGHEVEFDTAPVLGSTAISVSRAVSSPLAAVAGRLGRTQACTGQRQRR